MPIQCTDIDLAVALNFSPQVWHAEAAFVILKHVGAHRRQYGIDQNGQWDVRAVRIAGVVANFDSAYAKRLVHLIGSKSCTVGGSHGRNQIIDELLNLTRSQSLSTEFRRRFAQHGMPDLGDIEDSIHKAPCLGGINPAQCPAAALAEVRQADPD